MSKPEGERYTVAVDFDGVIHSYTSPWVNARIITDPPVPGAIEWLVSISQRFDIAIFTTRNHQWGGRRAVKRWLRRQLVEFMWTRYSDFAKGAWTHLDVEEELGYAADEILRSWSFPSHKPAALIYLDDRAYRFEGPGTFPTAEQIHAARPWNKPRVLASPPAPDGEEK